MNRTPELSPRCAAIVPELKAFADGELSFFAAMRVRQHLRSCPNCQEELVFMQTISEELERGEQEAPLTPELRERLLEQLPEHVETSEALPTKRPPTRKQLVARGGLALAGVAALIFAFNTWPGGGGSSPAPMSDSPASSISGSPRVFPPVPMQQAPGKNLTGGGNFTNGAAPLWADGHVKQSNENTIVDNAGNADSTLSQDGKANSTFSLNLSSPSAGNIVSSGSGSVFQNSIPQNAPSFVPPQRAVHREGSVTVAVDNAEDASDSVEALVKNAGGFVANNALSTGGDGKRSATLDTRIPVDKFEAILGKIGQLGTVRAKSINGEDVTERITKAGARKATLSDELSIREAQLRQKEKTAKKKDAMALYYLRAEVRDLRIRATQARAELEYIRKYAALANLFVTLQDKSKPVAPASWSGDLSNTGQHAVSSFIAASKLPIQLVIWILAYSPLWLPALVIWKKWGRQWLNS